MKKPIDQLDSAQHPWLYSTALQRLFKAVQKGGGEARAVGGAVRDALLGREVKEIDLATNCPPQQVTQFLADAGIKSVPTGLEHGTITAVIDGVGYEITTLRQDVETHGRHATIAFTDDWQKDAQRRDFTINALYADATGKLYDYTHGRDDLVARRVRFIGDAHTRIQEDVLRILRFFRFTAWFAHDVDAEALAACRDLAELIPQLSVERVWHEIIKLLASPDPSVCWQLMLNNDILKQILPEASNIVRLKSLLAVEKKYETPSHALVRFASVLPSNSKTAAAITKRLKLSNRETEKVVTLTTLPATLRGKIDPVPLRHALYEHKPDDVRDALLLLTAENATQNIDAALAIVSDWEPIHFLIQGADILKFGIPAGPKIGETLHAVEEWWIANDFRPSRDECLAEAKRFLGGK
jgi:poly(A) polymerase